ncbi:hypothetical protein HAPAU_29730 [Halalkalicoccus paucihalophilus]|uniref:DUF7982 domain-containing protein n=1 Tax=Halalkalicoccus paucihalophilus TaxID=1008153 RepID=A0A151AB19_9EURY|nr:hypothetical protein [Halalkalicoccus paucihalophilus]KYH24881.1 hypothetical protein HAPAU_29730 [Halalkalicoccus paucihalophilus]
MSQQQQSQPQSTADTNTSTTVDAGGEAEGDTELDERTTLAAQVELLQEENQRLRRAFSHARRTDYRRSATGLAILGVLAIGGAVLFSTVRTVLLALGATGLFAAVLSYYLTPERFVSAAVGEYVYAASVGNYDRLITELGLQETRLYIPTAHAGANASQQSARLFVPEHQEYTVPAREDLDSLLVLTDDLQERGAAFEPTGMELFREARQAIAGDIADEPDSLCSQLADAVVDVFELADSATTEVDGNDGRASIGITGSAYGAIDRFDHPVASLFGTGFALGLETPVTVEVTTGDDRADYLITCRWELDEHEEQ